MDILDKTPALEKKPTSFPVFSDPEPQALQWLIRASTFQRYPAGSYLFRSGQSVDEMRILVKGRLRLYR